MSTHKWNEYEALAKLEMETTKARYQAFTAILSISFVLPGLGGLATRMSVSSGVAQPLLAVRIFGSNVVLPHLVFLFGFTFFTFAVFHYKWHHRYSHMYRDALEKIERDDLKICVYSLRIRPRRIFAIPFIGKRTFALHFEVALYVIGIAYGFVVASAVGWNLFAIWIGGILVLYLMPALILGFLHGEAGATDGDCDSGAGEAAGS